MNKDFEKIKEDFRGVIFVWLDKTNAPIIHETSISYEKGSMFCVYEVLSRKVFKYPIASIFRVEEDYPQGEN